VKPYYQDDFATIYHGDCREVLPGLQPGVQLVLADLPYGLTSNKWDTPLNLCDLWLWLKGLCAPNAAYVFTASAPFNATLMMSNPAWFRHEWIWYKDRGSNFANTVREPMKEHEHILVFSQGKWIYNKQMEARRGSGAARAEYDLNWRSQSENYRDFEGREGQRIPKLRVPSSIQFFKIDKKGKHPTRKPEKLMAYLVATYSNEGDLVLDPTCGGGATLVAAKGLNRKSIGIEIEEKYCEIAANRLSQEVLFPVPAEVS
jgi:site-specific DNA-methyltransferase (adenine-specific)